MPKSNGRPLNRRRKTPKVNRPEPTCSCGGKATRFGLCVRCLDYPMSSLVLQANHIYLPSRADRRSACLSNVLSPRKLS